ncbi:hypothetical protein GCA01S_045_00290 [Parageobacillus caldoxylosilyticus NBRC 107762]|uniref:Uncharacterized protein n=1 Tax=Parageobacillus caldoxylosilyticus NBRC 107762 TaxID=1220594 RepID=A0A023DGU4_9BACL|nr:hypothetical protein GCA01S_045_00290 [Parageobacillus caldoxylosilyticus NBRC 107762]
MSTAVFKTMDAPTRIFDLVGEVHNGKIHITLFAKMRRFPFFPLRFPFSNNLVAFMGSGRYA